MNRSDGDRRRASMRRLVIVEGLIGALDRWTEVTDCVWNSPDRPAACEALQARFGFTEMVANSVLDMPTSRTTAQARMQLEEEAVELRRQL